MIIHHYYHKMLFMLIHDVPKHNALLSSQLVCLFDHLLVHVDQTKGVKVANLEFK